MSTSGESHASVVTPATRTEQCAADWLARKYDLEGWSSEDQSDLDAWLRETPAHLLAYTRLEATWNFANRLSALRPQEQALPRRPWGRSIQFRIAAAVVVLGIAVAALVSIPSPQTKERIFSTPLGGRQTLELADGSRIELNTNTRLRTAIDAKHRTIWLDKGEAYFQVKHDAGRPFVIFANGRRVTDLGTKFIMRSDVSRLQVALLEGRVEVDTASGGKDPATILTPGDEAIATADTVSVTRKSVQAVAEQLGWQRGVIVFNHTTLAEAAREFNRYNTKKISVSDARAANIAIDGTFPKDGVDAFVQAAREAFDLRAKETSSEVVLSR